jgi:diguanylate cyclase (GGDEF)-like protein
MIVQLLSCRDDAERGRLLDMSRRLRAMERRGSVLFVVAAIVGAPAFGALAALPALPGLALFWILQRRLDRYRRPELALLGCLAVLEVGLAVSLAMAHGPSVYLLCVLIMPVLLASVVFPARIAALVVVFGTQVMLAVALTADLAAVRSTPWTLLYPLAVMVAGSGIAMVVASLDVSTRGIAIVDPLTELPNRMALRARVAELEHQSQINRRPVALIVGDPDRFKGINDKRGHATGDAVLREVAARMRAKLPAAASVYRLGGEEFVVIVSDADVGSGAGLAERLRAAIGDRAIEGLAVAMSFGVAASHPGEAFDFSQLFGQADRALYEAKRAGGNRVRMWPLAGPGGVSANGNGAVSSPAQAHAELAYLEHEFDRREPIARDGDLAGERGVASNGRREPRPAEAELGDRWEHWNAKEHAATGNWLVRDEVQRRQLLELNRCLREKAKIAFLIGFAVGGLSAIQYGWQILVPPAVMAIIYVLIEHHIERFRHPEYVLGLGWIGLQMSFLASGLLANAPMIFAAPLLLTLVIGSSAVFPPRGVVVGLALTIGITFAVGFAEDPHLMFSAPGTLAFFLALLVSVGMLGSTIGRSTIEYRDLGIVDQLTGLFNRGALVSRVAELTHRSAHERSPVALVVADVDHFKAINDSYGHPTGDAVLREIGYRVRKNLRAFESAYRIGGEEFVIVLDEVDWRHAENVATRLRDAMRETPIAGVPTTASFGLAATKPGEAFDYEKLFKAADAALYAAKRAGGDNVFAGDGVMLAGELPENQADSADGGAAATPAVQTGA